MSFSWEDGRYLTEVDTNNSSYYYLYDGESNRTSKWVDDTHTQYIVVDGVLFGERKTQGTVLCVGRRFRP